MTHFPSNLTFWNVTALFCGERVRVWHKCRHVGTAAQSYNQHSLYPSQRTKLLAPKSKPLIRSDPSPLDWQPGPLSNLLKVTYWISVSMIYRLRGKSWPDQQRHWLRRGAVHGAEFPALHSLTECRCPWSVTWTQAITLDLAEPFRGEANQQLCV